MDIADIRFLYGFDRWATRKILDAAVGVDHATWSAPNVIGDRGLGGILVHQLGAQQRWRHFLTGAPGKEPTPERRAAARYRRTPGGLGAGVGRLRRLVRRHEPHLARSS
jgi:uncharacterized damage-inducible protein DinB